MYSLKRKVAPKNVMEVSPVLKEMKSLKKSLMLTGTKGMGTSGQECTQLNFQLVEGKLKKNLSSEGSHQQQKAVASVIEGKVAELGRFGHMVLALKLKIQERGFRLSLCSKGKPRRPSMC